MKPPQLRLKSSINEATIQAAKTRQDALEPMEAAWERIFAMKNDAKTVKRLREVQEAMQKGLIGREPESITRKFNKAEALRLHTIVAESQREGKLAALVAETPANYRLVLSMPELDAMIAKAIVEPMIALDTETTGLDVYVDVIVGVSVTIPSEDMHYYIPITPTQDGRVLDSAVALNALKPLIESASVQKVLHNASFDIAMFERHGIFMKGLAWDTLTAMKLLNENEPSFQLKDLVTKFLREPSDTFAELFGKDAKFAEIPLDVALVYGAKDTDVTWRLYQFQLTHLSKMPSILKYLREVEIPLIEAVYDMERTGFVIDTAFAETYGKKMLRDIARYERYLYAKLGTPIPITDKIEVGDLVDWAHPTLGKLRAEVVAVDGKTLQLISATETPFPVEQGVVYVEKSSVLLVKKFDFKPLNLNSVQQLKPVLEGIVGRELPNLDAKKTLKPLKDEFKVIRALLKYRELKKLHGTYISVLPELIHPVTGRLHVRMNPNGAKTGRFSSGGSGFNAQNQSKESRKLFIAPEGKVLIGADFSAQEVRCVAALTGEPALVKAFEEGKDPYATLASEFFGKPYEQVHKTADDKDTKERSMMKTAYLASLYGTGSGTLSKQLSTTPEEAQKFLDDFFARYKKIDAWIKETHKFLLANGYVWIGAKQRKRRLPAARGKGKKKKSWGYDPEVEGAKRQGPNARVQGASAIQTKTTIVAVHKWLQNKPGWRLWLTVHDELLLEAPEDFTRAELAEFEELMVNSYIFEGVGVVQNKTDIEVMRRWGEGVKVDTWFERGVDG